MERKLARIETITNILPIEGADAIELAQIQGWQVVTKKGEFKPGDRAVYFEIDSFLPASERYEFLRKSSYKKLVDGTEGFRLKTIKLRGQLSQGLALPLSSFGRQFDDFDPGTDVTDPLGVTKWEASTLVGLSGDAKGKFPSFIPKTDEERVQNLTREYEYWKTLGPDFYVTEKLDGSSMTAYVFNGEFGVCSRNIDLKEAECNSFWRMARTMNLEPKLRAAWENQGIAIQGELIGEGIQGNPYRLMGNRFMMFSAFSILTNSYLSMPTLKMLSNEIGVPCVPMLNHEFTLPDTIAELLSLAEGPSSLNPKTEREGVVIRSVRANKPISFKAISNKFLLKQK